MKIWLISIAETIPSDPGSPRLLRTGILAHEMARRGHQVTWWNSTVNHHHKTERAKKTTFEDMPEGLRLILLYGRLYKRNISITRIISQIENAREFKKAIPREENPDVILCSYPTVEVALAATRYARKHGIPIAVDFRDMWPDIMRKHVPSETRWLAEPILSYWERSVRWIVENATAIVGITDPFVDWALGKASRSRGPLDRAFHLAVNPKIPDAESLKAGEAFWDRLHIGDKEEYLVGSYSGALSRRHDFQSVVEGALRLPLEAREKIRLVFCGRGELQEELEQATHNAPHIIFAGWRDAGELHVLLQRSHFGLLPYRSHDDFVISYPNKVGEYLRAGLPIFTGLEGITKTMLQEKKLGYHYQEGNAKSVTETLSKLIASDEKKENRKQAHKVYREMFDAGRIYKEYGDYLGELAAHKS